MINKCIPYWLSAFLFTVLSNFSFAQDQDFYLFLLAGQSNMAGRGELEAEDTTTHPRIFVFNKEGDWMPAKEPLHFDKPSVVGVGPGFAFAKAMADRYPDKKIGLIPAAVGGSSILKWDQGGFHDQTKSYPYDDAVSRIQHARQDGVLKGVIWHQGESDSHQEGLEYYGRELPRLVHQLRDTLDKPGLPFIAGKMARFFYIKKPEAREINQIITRLNPQIDQFAVVTARGTSHKGDQTHFDSVSARKMGRRYAKKMFKLLKSSSSQ